jgi:UDP-N-acetylmuramate--alanine ligase
MSALAQLIKHQGFDVRGSDISPHDDIKNILLSQEIEVFSGHDGERLNSDDIVIISQAVNKHNSEIRKAKEMGLTVWHRAEALRYFLKDKKIIAITGTHGKTTTTYMIARVLREIMGEKVGMILGGIAVDYGSNFLPGEELYVVELDESDGSFLDFSPDIKIITDIDCDHLENYEDNFSMLVKSFERFLTQGGINIIQDGCLEKLNPGEIEYISYGNKENVDYWGEIMERDYRGSKIKLCRNSEKVIEYWFPLIGYKLALNSLSVFAVGDLLGLDLNLIAEGMRSLKGVRRRYEFKCALPEIKVIEDYAHHPREISEVINTVRDYLRPQRLIVVFQPHRYSRTRYLWEDFKKCFCQSDILLLTDIYPAFEEPIPGIESSHLAKEIEGVDCIYLTKEEIPAHLLQICELGDIILILGAGDINKISGLIVEKIKDVFRG